MHLHIYYTFIFILKRFHMICTEALQWRIMQYLMPHRLNSNWNWYWYWYWSDECMYVCVALFVFFIFYSFLDLFPFLRCREFSFSLRFVDMVIPLRLNLVRQNKNKDTCVWMCVKCWNVSDQWMNKWVGFLSLFVLLRPFVTFVFYSEFFPLHSQFVLCFSDMGD